MAGGRRKKQMAGLVRKKPGMDVVHRRAKDLLNGSSSMRSPLAGKEQDVVDSTSTDTTSSDFSIHSNSDLDSHSYSSTMSVDSTSSSLESGSLTDFEWDMDSFDECSASETDSEIEEILAQYQRAELEHEKQRHLSRQKPPLSVQTSLHLESNLSALNLDDFAPASPDASRRAKQDEIVVFRGRNNATDATAAPIVMPEGQDSDWMVIDRQGDKSLAKKAKLPSSTLPPDKIPLNATSPVVYFSKSANKSTRIIPTVSQRPASSPKQTKKHGRPPIPHQGIDDEIARDYYENVMAQDDPLDSILSASDNKQQRVKEWSLAALAQDLEDDMDLSDEEPVSPSNPRSRHTPASKSKKNRRSARKTSPQRALPRESPSLQEKQQHYHQHHQRFLSAGVCSDESRPTTEAPSCLLTPPHPCTSVSPPITDSCEMTSSTSLITHTTVSDSDASLSVCSFDEGGLSDDKVGDADDVIDSKDNVEDHSSSSDGALTVTPLNQRTPHRVSHWLSSQETEKGVSLSDEDPSLDTSFDRVYRHRFESMIARDTAALHAAHPTLNIESLDRQLRKMHGKSRHLPWNDDTQEEHHDLEAYRSIMQQQSSNTSSSRKAVKKALKAEKKLLRQQKEAATAGKRSLAAVVRLLEAFMADSDDPSLTLTGLSTTEKSDVRKLARLFALKQRSRGHGKSSDVTLIKTRESALPSASELRDLTVLLYVHRHWKKEEEEVVIEKRHHRPSSKTTTNSSKDPRFTAVLVAGTVVGAHASPIGEHNIGHQMMRKLGWSPGSGLGVDQGGMVQPVDAVIRGHRRGLGL